MSKPQPYEPRKILVAIDETLDKAMKRYREKHPGVTLTDVFVEGALIITSTDEKIHDVWIKGKKCWMPESLFRDYCDILDSKFEADHPIPEAITKRYGDPKPGKI